MPLPSRYRVLALRAEGVFTNADSGQACPSTCSRRSAAHRAARLPRVPLPRREQPARAEYRWEAWWALDGALFVDAGTVAPTRSDLTLRDIEVAYGIGFRFHSNSAFVARLDLAFSREGFIPLLRFEHVF